jgi:hypothetical protein
MWQFSWGVFWAVLVAFGLVKLVGRAVSMALPVNVTLCMRDFQAIVGKLESIEASLAGTLTIDATSALT